MSENSFIETVNKIRDNLDVIIASQDMFSEETIGKLEFLSDIDLTLILDDFAKGNYLGNRKVDIDLSLNNLSLVELPTYKQADIILVDGTLLNIPFDNESGGILELTSHADIKNYIVNHELYSQVVDTEMVVAEAFGSTNAMIRVRDADGKASNVERIELHVYTGTVVDTKPVYFWAKTTSSLETLANRVGDIIQLGNDIDSIVLLSQRIDELISLQSQISNILAVNSELSNVVLASQNIDSVNTNAINIDSINTIAAKATELSAIYADISGILESSENSENATEQALIATQKSNESAGSALSAANSAALALSKSNEIKAITAQAQTLVSGSIATASYNSVDGKFTFGIPQGLKGDKGDAFTVNGVGLAADISLYDTQIKGFSFLAIDTALIYFKLSNTSGDWSLGSPFGKGDKGDKGETGVSISNVSFLSTTDSSGLASQGGATDTYRITFSDSNTSDFNIHNGVDTDITSEDLLSHTNKTNNPHAVTKAQVGLSNVDNTSDEDKPVSLAQQTALDLKLNANANAISATKLATPIKINGIDFDGTEDINVSATIIDRPIKLSTDSISVDGITLTLATPIAGTDYYINLVDETYSIATSKSSDTIGGFHYSLIPSGEAATGNKTEADMVAIRGINAYSIWTKWFRPVAEPEGMVFIGNKWYDIYLLNSEHITNGTSKAGATIAAGAADANGRAVPKIPLEYGGNGTLNYGKFTWFQACEVAKSHGKEVIPYAEFPTIAYGVTEGKSSQTDGYETVVGKVEHYPHLTSKYGIEQASGVQWIWGKDVGADSSATGWQDQADGRGQIYGGTASPKAVLLGGFRDNGVLAGSRASNWYYPVWFSNWGIGSRCACDHLELV